MTVPSALFCLVIFPSSSQAARAYQQHNALYRYINDISFFAQQNVRLRVGVEQR